MIVAFLYIFAMAEVGYGIGNIVGLKNEMLGALAIGFGILTAALAAYLWRSDGAENCFSDLPEGSDKGPSG